MKLKNGLYCQKNTRKSCLFSPPNTVWPAEGAKRPFSPIFVDFDKQAQKLHQNKPRSASNTGLTSNKGISGVIPDIFLFIYTDPSQVNLPPPLNKKHTGHMQTGVSGVQCPNGGYIARIEERIPNTNKSTIHKEPENNRITAQSGASSGACPPCKVPRAGLGGGHTAHPRAPLSLGSSR